MGEMATLAEMPAEVLAIIVKNLTTQERVWLTCTCKALWAARRSEHLFSEVRLAVSHPPVHRKSLCQWLVARRDAIKSLFMEFQPDKDLLSLLRCLSGSGLETLDLVIHSKGLPVGWGQLNLPCLRALQLAVTDFSDLDHWNSGEGSLTVPTLLVGSGLSQSGALQALSLSTCPAGHIEIATYGLPPSLTSLEVAAETLHMHGPLSPLYGTTALQRLRLLAECCSGAPVLLRRLPLLKHLELSNASEANCKAAVGLTQLTSLTLHRQSEILEDDSFSLLEVPAGIWRLPVLKELDIRRCRMEAPPEPAPTVQRLTRLALSAGDAIDHGAYLRQLTALRSLALEDAFNQGLNRACDDTELFGTFHCLPALEELELPWFVALDMAEHREEWLKLNAAVSHVYVSSSSVVFV